MIMTEKTSEEVWNGILKLIQDNVPAQSFKTWFEPIAWTSIRKQFYYAKSSIARWPFGS